MAETPLSLSGFARSRRVRLLSFVQRALRRLTGGRVAVVPYLLVAQPIGLGRLASLRDDPDTRVEPLDAADPRLQGLPRPDEVLRRRFAAASRCHLATVKGDFAGCIWIARGHYDEDEVRCRYLLDDPRRSVWDFDVYVAPSYRSGRLLGRMWKAVDAALAGEGVAWSFSRISPFNLASVQSHERLGAVGVGWALFLVVGRLQCALFSQRPFIQIGLASPGPVLRMRIPGRR